MGMQIPKGGSSCWKKVAASCKVETLYDKLGQNGWTDRDAVWDKDSGGPKNHVLEGIEIYTLE